MSKVILKAENISKQYRLGLVGTGTLHDDFKRNWARLLGKEDPFLKVGEVNDRSKKGNDDYVWALRDIDFEVNQGEVLGIIGKNGAGKSTLLKILSQVTSATTGKIKSRGRIASLLEVGTGFHPELTGRENIFLNGAILGMSKAEINSKLDEIIDFSGCERYIDTPVKRYSSGMTVRLGFAVAAHLEPEILVVDEVLAVGDAEFQKKAIGKMQDITRGEGRTVLFVSHNMASVRGLCSKVMLLNNGSILEIGETNSVVQKYYESSISNIDRKVEISEKHKKYSVDPRVKINTIEMVAYESKNEKIKFKVNYDSQMAIQSASISGSIISQAHEVVGSFFSKNYMLEVGEKSLDFTVFVKNLVAGIYYLNFSINSGNVFDGNLKLLDHAVECLSFEVKPNEYTYHWNRAWGNIRFDCELE